MNIRLTHYLKTYITETVMAPTFKMLEALLELFVPLVVASIIDKGIAAGDRSYIINRCLLLLLLAAIGLACSVTAQYFSAKAAVGAATQLRAALFSHIQSFGYKELDEIGSPTLITRLTSDILQVQNAINLTLRLFLRSPFIVFGAMIMAFTIDPGIAIQFVITIILLFLVVFGIMFLTRPVYRKVQGRMDEILTIARENLSGVRVIRAFRLEQKEITHFQEENEQLTGLQKLAGMLSGLTNPITFLIINAAILVLVYSGGLRVNAGTLTVGAVVALYNYMSQILIELIKLANLIITMTRGLASYDRISDVFQVTNSFMEGEECDVNLHAKESVAFDHVSFSYHESGEPVLSDITFQVARGQVIGIIGGTGCGKTTLINLIPRFYETKEGNIRLFGKDIRQYTHKTLLKMIAVVPQKAQLFSGTVRDNILFGNGREELLHLALDASQATEFVDSMENGTKSMISQGGKNLSGGQRQRLTIARAIAADPEILILDDSASALDYATDAKLRAAIRGLPSHPTVFVVSQRASSVRFADHIIVLDNGKIVGQGSHESLLHSCSVYQEIYASHYRMEGA